MKPFCIFFVIIILSVSGLSAQEMNSIGARAAGVGNTSSTLEDPYATFNNIAGTATLTGVQLGSNLENRFGLKSLSTVAFAAAIQTQIGVPSISLSKYGDNNFSEQTVGIGLGHSLDKVLLGVKLNYYQIRVDEVQSRHNLLANFGGIVKFYESLIFGASVSNFNLYRISKEKHFVPVYLRTGLSYRHNKSLMINIDVEKNIQYDGIIKLGIEYTIANRLMIRTGTTSQNFSPHFGAGFKSNVFQFDYALTSSSILGFIHQVSFSFKIKGK